jgi:hypothetical protein
MYTVEQINHIIYNNRTYEGVVKNFMPKIEFHKLSLLLEIGNQVKFANKIVNKDASIIIDREKLDLEEPDIELFPEQLENIKVSSRNFNEAELELLKRKKIPQSIIEQYDISPLSQFEDDLEILKILGVTTHPILVRLIGDGISDGLIIPLYKDSKLINTIFRKTNDITKLKYGITVPSLDFWGDEIIEREEIWICEGLFDMMAIRDRGKRCISASSCSLNDYQYFQIIKNRPSLVNIFTDNDVSGYRSAMKSQKIFGLNGIPSKVYSSEKGKDAGEHFFELELDWNTVKEIRITSEMISRDDFQVDFLKYLEERKF